MLDAFKLTWGITKLNHPINTFGNSSRLFLLSIKYTEWNHVTWLKLKPHLLDGWPAAHWAAVLRDAIAGLSMLRFSLLMLMLLGPSVALAQHAGTTQEQRACSRDANHFCRKDLGDDNAVQQCLQQNRNRLSMSCRRVFESHGM